MVHIYIVELLTNILMRSTELSRCDKLCKDFYYFVRVSTTELNN